MPKSEVDILSLYSRDKNLKQEDIEILQEWLKKQPHLPKLKEYQILGFLHSCFYRIEATKTTIDNYFTMRTHNPHIFNCLPENILKHCSTYVSAVILPKKTPEDYTVLFVKLADPNPDIFNFTHFVSIINMVLTLYFHQNGFATGGCVIFDTKGFSFSHLTKFNLSVLKNSLDHVQNGAPIRIKGIHFINVVPALDKFKIMIKPILNADLYNMIIFHLTIDTLTKQIPLECLPEEYGGSLPSTQVLQEKNLKNISENYDFFHWHDSQTIDETKRLSGTRGPIFGMEGTFKKIELD